jgi:uncharacterized repeat protein (TIGR01451 family)
MMAIGSDRKRGAENSRIRTETKMRMKGKTDMRILKRIGLVAAAIIFGASNASAVGVFLTSDYAGGVAAPSDLITVTVHLDFEGEPNPGIQFLSVGVRFDSDILVYEQAQSSVAGYLLYTPAPPAEVVTILYPNPSTCDPACSIWPGAIPALPVQQVNIDFLEPTFGFATSSDLGPPHFDVLATLVFHVAAVGDGAAEIEIVLDLLSGNTFTTPSGETPMNLSGSFVVLTADSEPAPDLSATKSDSLLVDQNGDGDAGPGDILQYAVEISNVGTADAASVVFTDAPDANTTLVDGSVVASQGNVDLGNGGGDTSVEVDVGTIPVGDTVTIGFEVEIDGGIPEGTTQIANQGNVGADDVAGILTDDPDTGAADDPTRTPIVISTQCETDLLQCEDDLADSGSDLTTCEDSLDMSETDLLQCQGDLSTSEDSLNACLVNPPFEDADGDGEHDNTDLCPSTPAGESVDSAGCSLSEFCASLAVPAACNNGDWKNDEPVANAQDCRITGGACLPR